MEIFHEGVSAEGNKTREGMGLALRLGAELLVVFVGVLGAFWVEGYSQKLEDRQKAGAILEALAAELNNFVVEGPNVVEGMSRSLAQYDERSARGERPPPAFYREPGAETPSISVWNSALASGAVDLLDPQLFFTLAAFYNRVESASARYVRYNLFTEQEILPLLSLGPSAFYDPSGETIEPRFEVHMDMLRTLRDEVAVVVDRADEIRQQVLAERENMR